MQTQCAPAGRASPSKLKELTDQSFHDPVIQVVLQAVSGYVMILNAQRQILAANQELLDHLKTREMDTLVGSRVGEAFECEFCREGPDGCGTSSHCRACGAVLAILASQANGKPAKAECWMPILRNGKRESAEFNVRVTPLELAGAPVSVFVLWDISSEKRRQLLERVFLHDVRNTLCGLDVWVRLLKAKRSSEAAEMIVAVASRLRQEVDDQQLLCLAEGGRLGAKVQEVAVNDVLEETRRLCAGYADGMGRRLRVVLQRRPRSIRTDSSLLTRVLVNMVRNAVEASKRDETVKMWYRLKNGCAAFSVYNRGAMKEDVALSIFRRSFSTKGERGRGIGTYCMKLFGEQYLGGKVSFTTSRKKGTTFTIVLPKQSRPAGEG